MRKFTVTGNVSNDAEIRYDKNGEAYVTFKLITKIANKDNYRFEYVEVSCNGQLVELARASIRKGIRIFIDGFPSFNAFINHNNLPVCRIRLYAHTIELLDKSYSEGDTKTDDIVHDVPDKIQTVILPNTTIE